MNRQGNDLHQSDIIGSVVFLIWFFISIIALVASAKKGMIWLAIAVFGQYFLVFGVIACIKLSKDKKLLCNSMIWSVVALGFLALLYGIDARNGVQMTRFLIIGGISVIGCGIIVLIGPVLDVYLKKHRCTYSIRAEVIEVRTMINTRHTNAGTKRTRFYCPVYKIYYQGRDWQLCSGHFEQYEIFEGQAVNLNINPKNPVDFYDSLRRKGLRIAYCVFAVCYLIAGTALLYLAGI